MKKRAPKQSKKQTKKNAQKLAYRTWVEVDYKAIEKNARTLKSLLADNVPLMGVVKSNAYGHGMVASARAVLAGGATWLGVDELSEALELRKARIKAPILVLGYTLPELYREAAAQKVSITISSLDSLRTLAAMRLPKKLRIHLKFDTGLHRQGIQEPYIQQVIRTISAPAFPALIEGAYTHYAVMEDPMRQEFSRMQTRAFRNMLARLNQKGFAPITHASATSGILFSKDFNFDMARAGIGLYGLWPSPEIRKWAGGGSAEKTGEGSVALAPALAWKAVVSEVKLAEKSAKVGYDLTHELSRPSRIAVVPVGYWHGIPRSLSNKGSVVIRGKRANIIGRVSMDMIIVDVTDIPTVHQGDLATIIGPGATADEFAEKAGTITYEAVTRINPLLPRIAI